MRRRERTAGRPESRHVPKPTTHTRATTEGAVAKDTLAGGGDRDFHARVR